MTESTSTFGFNKLPLNTSLESLDSDGGAGFLIRSVMMSPWKARDDLQA